MYAGLNSEITYLSTYTSKLDHQQHLFYLDDIKEHINFHKGVWKEKVGKKARPECVLCLRQGVAQNEFQPAYECEHQHLESSILSKRTQGGPKQPRVTYVVV